MRKWSFGIVACAIGLTAVIGQAAGVLAARVAPRALAPIGTGVLDCFHFSRLVMPLARMKAQTRTLGPGIPIH